MAYCAFSLALGFLAGAAIVVIYDRRHDVLHGGYIERSLSVPDESLRAEQAVAPQSRTWPSKPRAGSESPSSTLSEPALQPQQQTGFSARSAD